MGRTWGSGSLSGIIIRGRTNTPFYKTGAVYLIDFLSKPPYENFRRDGAPLRGGSGGLSYATGAPSPLIVESGVTFDAEPDQLDAIGYVELGRLDRIEDLLEDGT